ncbi:MAG: hypothetical protein QN135_10590 [Armatimonadota bacterium]|nr:hypothetical protein [Armatimonadota bacterium]
MSRTRLGGLLVLAGIFLAVVVRPYVADYAPGYGHFGEQGVVLIMRCEAGPRRTTRWLPGLWDPRPIVQEERAYRWYCDPTYVPYRHVAAGAIFLTAVGAGVLVWARVR